MFFKNKKSLNNQINELKEKNSCLEKELIELKEKNCSLEKTIEKINKNSFDNQLSYERKLKQQEEDYKRELNFKENECRNSIQLILKDKELSIKESVLTYEKENSSLKQRVEILESAFCNMGSDVKNMTFNFKDVKDILDSLAGAVVSKNTVNIVK